MGSREKASKDFRKTRTPTSLVQAAYQLGYRGALQWIPRMENVYQSHIKLRLATGNFQEPECWGQKRLSVTGSAQASIPESRWASIVIQLDNWYTLLHARCFKSLQQAMMDLLKSHLRCVKPRTDFDWNVNHSEWAHQVKWLPVPNQHTMFWLSSSPWTTQLGKMTTKWSRDADVGQKKVWHKNPPNWVFSCCFESPKTTFWG